MFGVKPLTVTGNNPNGDNVVDYLLYTESLNQVTGYYGAKDEEDTIRYRGRGAEVLGLLGKPVVKEAMLELAAGFSPDGLKTPLCQNAGALPTKKVKLDRDGNPRLDKNGNPVTRWEGGHQVGYDCTFSAPKSVSVLFALADPEERSKILAAHRRAVDQGLEFIEGIVETRRGKGGKEYLDGVGLVITSCDHVSSRNLDPSLHTHSLVYGVGYGPDGKWTAWESSELMRRQKQADTIYQSHLAANLRALGYGIEQSALVDKEGQDTGVRQWEVAGIEQSTIDTFSSRTKEITAAMSNGLSHHDAWARTRKHKDEPSPAELFATWEKVIPAMGQDCDIARLKARTDIQAPRRSDDEILEALHKTTAIVNDADIQWAVYRARAGEGPDALARDVQALKDQMVKIAPKRQHAIDQGLSPSREFTETRYADRRIVDWEQEVSRRAEQRRDDTTVRVPQLTLDRVVADFQAEKGFTLSDEQRDAVNHLCVNSGGHTVMAGVAGAGKTTVAELYKRGFEANGQHLIGACVSRKAAGKLEEESGMESMSITKLLGRLDRGAALTDTMPGLNSKSVVVLDEAGMVDTEQVRRLMRHVDDAGAKLILQGDMKQLQPIGAGAGMALVSEKLGQAELTEIRRQKQVEDRDIAQAFYDRDDQGRIILDNRGPKSRSQVASKGALVWNKLEDRGCIDAYDSRPEAADACVNDWLNSPHAIDNRLLLVHDHADSQMLTTKIRAGLRERGVLQGDNYTFKARRDQREYDMTVALGDRVRITKNDSLLGVENGDMAIVEDITKTAKGLALSLRVEGTKGQPSFAVTVATDEWNHLQAGYARTVHDAQGQGKAEVFHFANARMMDNQSALVAFTRLTSDRYRMYGADVELEQVKNRLGADRLKQNATQEGFWKERGRQTPEQGQERQRRRDPGLQI